MEKMAVFEIGVPQPVAECFMLRNTTVTKRDIALIIRAMKNESMRNATARDRLVELSLLFERIVNETWVEKGGPVDEKHSRRP